MWGIMGIEEVILINICAHVKMGWSPPKKPKRHTLAQTRVGSNYSFTCHLNHKFSHRTHRCNWTDKLSPRKASSLRYGDL